MERKIENAVINSVRLDKTEGFLSIWVDLRFGFGGQGFGGYALYSERSFEEQNVPHCGHFVWRVLEIAGVSDWSDITGKTVRIDHDSGKIYGIGHIIEDDWFYPGKDFERMRDIRDVHEAEQKD